MKQLKFMHITKTGGSSIEFSAKDSGVLWGRFDPIITKNVYHLKNIEHVSILYLKDKLLYEKLKEQYEWFVIVRNPYDRIVSLVNYFKTYESYRFRNVTIIDILNMSLNSQDFTAIPATEYVYDKNEKIVKHVLKFENLENEFDDLMKLYNLNIKLTKKVNVSDKYITLNDLKPEHIRKINIKYKDDFENFGYEMINV